MNTDRAYDQEYIYSEENQDSLRDKEQGRSEEKEKQGQESQEDAAALLLRKMRETHERKSKKEKKKKMREVKKEEGTYSSQPPPEIKFQSEEQKKRIFIQACQRQMSIYCPCGQRVGGPIYFFQHVQTQHKNDNLQQLYRIQQLRRIIQNPSPSAQQCMLIQSIDKHDFKRQLTKISRSYKRQEYVCKDFTEHEKQGGYGQAGQLMICQLTESQPEKWLLLQFFHNLKHFVMRRWSRQRWLTGSPAQMVELANHFFYYYRVVRRDLGADFGPIKVCHMKRLIYIFIRWMFEKKLIDDRIIRADGADLEKDQENEQILTAEHELAIDRMKEQPQ